MSDKVHKCEKDGCNNYIDLKYHYCYEHRTEPYIGHCRVHGDTMFSVRGCLECSKLKRANYRIHRRRSKTNKNKWVYYLGQRKLEEDNYLKPWYRLLLYPNRNNARKYVKPIIKGPGIYGIFVRSKRFKDGLGECLYIGQSINVKKRIGQHMDNIQAASAYIATGGSSKISRKDIPKMYYGIATYGLQNLKFVKLTSIDSRTWSKLNRREREDLLTVLEQFNFDSFQPKYNVVQAAPSDFSRFMNDDGSFK